MAMILMPNTIPMNKTWGAQKNYANSYAEAAFQCGSFGKRSGSTDVQIADSVEKRNRESGCVQMSAVLYTLKRPQRVYTSFSKSS